MPILNIIGVVLGLFLTPYLIFKKNRKQHDWFATLFVLTLTVRLFAPLAIDYSIKPLVVLIPVLPYFIGPLLYLLIRSIYADNSIKVYHLIHGLPALVMFFYIYFFAEVLPGVKPLRVDIPLEHSFWSLHGLLGSTTIISLFGYGIAALFLLMFINKNQNSTEKRAMRQPAFMITAYLFVIVFIFVFEFSEKFSAEMFMHRHQIHTAASVILIVFFSYLNLQTREVSAAPMIEEIETLPLEQATYSIQKTTYSKSAIDEKMLKELKTKVENYYLSEKPYLDSDFTIDDLSLALSISKHHLSQVFSRSFNESFYHYTNRCRVNEVIEMLNHPEYKNFSILRLGFEAGFNSKTAFNRAFKYITSMTPSQYREKIEPNAS